MKYIVLQYNVLTYCRSCAFDVAALTVHKYASIYKQNLGKILLNITNCCLCINSLRPFF